jgi:hypothetical protein
MKSRSIFVVESNLLRELDPKQGVQLVEELLPWSDLKDGRALNGLLILIPVQGAPTAEHRKPLGEIPNVDLVFDVLDRKLAAQN